MDCPLIQPLLIGYHFATGSDDERATVEAHLVECRHCLRTYLALKTHVDRGTSDEDVPSEPARLRLRAAVAARFRPSKARRVRGWLTRPVPLYQGLAVVAAIVVAAVVGPSLARKVRSAPLAEAGQRVDTARPAAESLTIY